MKVSCGAILYTFDHNNNIGIILGLESCGWLPFKGRNEFNETYEETAIREIYEETCGVVKLDTINLDHKFVSKNKTYYIGLIYVPYNFIDQFNIKLEKETREEFKEKKSVKFFKLYKCFNDKKIHYLSKNSIEFYLNDLININYKNNGQRININDIKKERQIYKTGCEEKLNLYFRKKYDIDYLLEKYKCKNVNVKSNKRYKIDRYKIDRYKIDKIDNIIDLDKINNNNINYIDKQCEKKLIQINNTKTEQKINIKSINENKEIKKLDEINENKEIDEIDELNDNDILYKKNIINYNIKYIINHIINDNDIEINNDNKSNRIIDHNSMNCDIEINNTYNNIEFDNMPINEFDNMPINEFDNDVWFRPLYIT
jgi:hypothetical protein